MFRTQPLPLTEENKIFIFFSIFHVMPETEYVQARAICRAARKAAQKVQLGPYKTKASFVMAFTGQFYSNKKLTSHFENSYKYYTTILSSSIKSPAAIYKLRENPFDSEDKSIKFFNANEDAYENGRIYQTQKHNWACNEVWLVANIHKGRSFIIFSDVSPDNMMREKNPFVYSAFAREIAEAIKAGYRPTILENGRIELEPPSNQGLCHLTVEDIQCENAEVEETYSTLHLFSMYARRVANRDDKQSLNGLSSRP